MTDARFNIVVSAEDKYSKVVKEAEQKFRNMVKPIHEAREGFEKFSKAVGIEKGVEHFEHLGSAIDKVTEKLGGIERPLRMFTSIGTFAGLAETAIAWGEMGEKIGIASKNIGISAVGLQSFQRAAELSGVSSDQAASGLQNLGSTLQDAQYGRNPAALNLMSKLGVHLRRTSTGAVDTAESMHDIADAVQRFKGQPQIQAQIANTFGVGDLLPLLRRGGNELDDFKEKVKKTGAVMSDQDVDKATGFTESVRLFGDALVGIKNQIGSNASVMTPYIEKATEVIENHRQIASTAVEASIAIAAMNAAMWATPKIFAGSKLALAAAAGGTASLTRSIYKLTKTVPLVGEAFGSATLGLKGFSTMVEGLGMGAGGGMLAGLAVVAVGVEGLVKEMEAPWHLFQHYWHELWPDLTQTVSTEVERIRKAIEPLNPTILGTKFFFPKWGAKQDRGAQNIKSGIGEQLHERLWETGPDGKVTWFPNPAASVSGQDNQLIMGSGGAPGPSGFSRPDRNHNPWDLRGWNSTGPHDAAGFDQFTTADSGIIAASRQLMTYQDKHGIDTIAGIVSRASPASDGNNTPAMIAAIAAQSGYDPNAHLDLHDQAVQQKLLPALFSQEGGKEAKGFTSDQILRDILEAIKSQGAKPVNVSVSTQPGGMHTIVQSNGTQLPVGYAMPTGGP